MAAARPNEERKGFYGVFRSTEYAVCISLESGPLDVEIVFPAIGEVGLGAVATRSDFRDSSVSRIAWVGTQEIALFDPREIGIYRFTDQSEIESFLGRDDDRRAPSRLGSARTI